MSALGIAIQLRIKTREAIDADDTPEICRWNRLADAAYASLSPSDAAKYREWVWEGLDKAEFIGAGGDA